MYAALEEPDYVVGLAAIRKEEPSLEEMIRQHTVMANFQARIVLLLKPADPYTLPLS